MALTNTLTYRDTKWLEEHGGRTLDDVIFDPDGRAYVLMYTPTGDQKVYLPSSERFY